MNYGLIYTIPFASLRNETCIIEIEKEGYTGEATELTGSASPFTVTIEDTEFLYTPLRLSTARIRIVGNDYLQSLFSTAYQQYRVTFKRDGCIVWCGFIKPELYTQDYSSDKFELEIECISALSTLEYIRYKDDGSRSFVSLWDLLKKCITVSVGRYENVYIPHVYARTPDDYSTGDNVLEIMKVSEQDFFDEEDEAMSLKEVLEEICKLLNWTVCDWGGSLYFVDADHTGEYYKYSPDLKTKIGGITPNELIIQNIGFAGGDHSLDILPGYNHATVRTSNYPVGALLPSDDFSKMDILASPEDIVDGNRRSHQVVLFPRSITTILYDSPKGSPNEIKDLTSYKNRYDKLDELCGAVNLRYCNYNMKEENGEWVPDITDYSYTDTIRIRQRSSVGFIADEVHPLISIKGKSAVYSDGAFAISGSMKLYGDFSGTNLSPLVGVTNRSYSYLRFSLRIGNKYYNGEGGWVENPNTRFFVKYDHKSDVEYTPTENTKKLSMPYKGLNGYIIEIPKALTGDLELCVYSSYSENIEMGEKAIYTGLFLKDFKFIYQKADWVNEDSNSDRYYENVVNEDYVNELDEIEFKISSYNNDGACYSKVLLGDNYLTNNLYSSIVDKNIRPEEFLIQRIVNRYSSTKIKLTQVIREDKSLTPISVLYDNFLVGKKFLNIGGEIDYCYCQFKCIMIENV